FREKYRSVWVDIPSRLYDPQRGHHVYHEYMDQLEYADALGFDGIGVNEHHQNGYGLMPSPNLIAATLARRTSRAAICVIGNSIATWDFCLDHDYNYSYLSFFGYLRAKSLMDGYWDRVAKRGKDESPYRAGFAQIICVADTDADAERLYAEHCLYFFNRCLHIHPPFADPPGYRTINTIKFGALSAFQKTGLQVLQHLTWKQLLDERFVVAGSPETVRQQLEECIKGLRVGQLFCLFHNGDMPD